MSTISAVLIAYNEEERIERVLRSVAWCDEIVVVDKSSTDRTREIALRYTDRVITVPYSGFDVPSLRRLAEESTSEWLLWVFGSDLVTVALADELRRLISRGDFPYDVIAVPFRRYVLGLEGPRSPWFGDGLNRSVMRRSTTIFREDDVHGAIASSSNRIYRMTDAPADACLYHLTHMRVDTMMDRHVRYGRAEGELTAQRVSLRRAAASVLRATFDVIFRRRTWRLGWDGVALSFAYISYWMLRYLYIWEKKRSSAPDVYARIRREVMDEWEKR